MRGFAIYLTMLLSSIGANAQHSNLALGLTSGINATGIRTTNSIQSNFKTKFRFSVGAHVELKLSQTLYLQGGLGYEAKGARSFKVFSIDSIGNITNEFTSHQNYGYLTVPVLLKYKIKRQLLGESFYLTPGIGCYGGMLVSRTEKLKIDGKNEFVYRGNRYDDRIDFGLSIMLDLEYPISKGLSLSAGSLVNYGLHNVIKYPDQSIFPSLYRNAKHTVFNFLVGARYALPKKGKHS